MEIKKIIESVGKDGKKVLSNILNKNTGRYLEYKEIEGVTDQDVLDGKNPDLWDVYIKYKDGKYYIMSEYLDKGKLFLEKDSIAEVRAMSTSEILLLKIGYYKGVRVNGYYEKGDTPAPIEYFLSDTEEEDDGGSVLYIGDIAIVHKFNESINILYYGAKCNGSTVDTVSWQNAINYCKNNVTKSIKFTGTSVIDKTIYFDFPGLTIEGDSVFTSTLLKKGNLTNTDIESNDGFDYTSIDAVITSVNYVGDFTFTKFKIKTDSNSDYGIFTYRTYRFKLEDIYIESAKQNLRCHQTWNCNIRKVRSRFSEYAFVFEGGTSGNPLQHTSISFDNTYAEYCKFGYKLNNVTYFSGNSMSADNVTDCCYWFIFSTGAVNGMGTEKSSGQLIRCWASNITVNGHSVLEIKNLEGIAEEAKSTAKFEVVSMNRNGVGLVINSSEIRGYPEEFREGNATYSYVEPNTMFQMNGYRHYEITTRNINNSDIIGNAKYIRNNIDGYRIDHNLSSPFEVNGVSVGSYIYGYNQTRVINRQDEVVIINTQSSDSSRTSISVPLSVIRKSLPDFGGSDPYVRDFYNFKLKTNVSLSITPLFGVNVYSNRVSKISSNSPYLTNVEIDSANDLVTFTFNGSANRPIVTLSRVKGSLSPVISNSPDSANPIGSTYSQSEVQGILNELRDLKAKMRVAGILDI